MAVYESEKSMKDMAAGKPPSDLDDSALGKVAPVPYEETDEELLWTTLVDEHQQKIGEKRGQTAYLLEAYQTTQ